MHPTIAITTGEPAGIGPDICLQIITQPQNAKLVFIGCPMVIEQRAKILNIPVKIKHFDHLATKSQPYEMEMITEPTLSPVTNGLLDYRNSQYVIRLLNKAVSGCQQGWFDAMTTAPIHKGIINEAGIPFTGHTEYLASLTETEHVVMMLANQNLRVALATTHLPLSKVSANITQKSLFNTLQVLDQSLQKQFKISKPKILVCGLNPHAGENGFLGLEEIQVITPVINQCHLQGMNIEGPLPADTIFQADADAILTMYHDQGLPVIKFSNFGEIVNITLGLPIIRTSVDHGTALHLAGTGHARSTSLQHAINFAINMSK